MRGRWGLLCVLLGVSGCVTARTATPVFAPTGAASPPCEQICALPEPSSTSSPSPVPPVATATPTPLTECEVEASDYCMEDGFFVLRAPLAVDEWRVDPTYRYGSTQEGTRVPHHGVEFPYPAGTPVLAAADGVVWYAGDDGRTLFAPWPNFYGNLVVLEHTLPAAPYARLYTLYAHLSRVDVHAGQTVRAGEPIGQIGMSGSAVGAHLHFEVRLAAGDYFSTLNPELYLQPLAGRGALALRVVNAAGAFVAVSPHIQLDPAAGGPPLALDVEPYASETIHPHSYWQENMGLNNLPAGRYRLTVIYRGKLYERWVRVEAGKLTLVSWRLE